MDDEELSRLGETFIGENLNAALKLKRAIMLIMTLGIITAGAPIGFYLFLRFTPLILAILVILIQ